MPRRQAAAPEDFTEVVAGRPLAFGSEEAAEVSDGRIILLSRLEIHIQSSLAAVEEPTQTVLVQVRIVEMEGWAEVVPCESYGALTGRFRRRM